MGDISPKRRKNKSKDLAVKKSLPILTFLIIILIGIGITKTWSQEDQFYAHAYELPLANNKEFKFLITAEAKNVIIPADDIIDQDLKENAIDILQTDTDKKLKDKLYEMVGNSPIKDMVEHIAKKDQRVAALLIGIAKKESSFGSASPSKDGKTCFNYWGYKGSASRGTGMGYACFSDEKEAVEVVGQRIKNLVDKNLDTPSKMIVWKCGSSCAGHDKGSVKKWISDVEIYFNRIMEV
jgi:hypothetical protein